MKKVVAAVLACSMLIVFTGCKNQNGTCRWNPFSRTNTVCYTPSCEIPVTTGADAKTLTDTITAACKIKFLM